MKLVDELRDEHVLIERVAGSLRSYASERLAGRGDSADGAGYLRFFRLYSGGFHHAREEDTLIPALVAHAEIRADSGPVVSILLQHREMEKVLAEAEPFLAAPGGTVAGSDRLLDLVTTYARALWLHIDAENSVLFPESEERLRRSGVPELRGRAPTPEEAAAGVEGERLATRYPAVHDPGAIRGDGCAVCPSHGVTCEGVEREWWSEWEWEAFRNAEE